MVNEDDDTDAIVMVGETWGDDEAAAGLIRILLLIAVASLAALALTGCERLFPDVEDWIADSETLARRFDTRLGDLKECVEEDNCDEAVDPERGAFAMCSWVTSGGELAPEGFEAAGVAAVRRPLRGSGWAAGAAEGGRAPAHRGPPG